MRDIHGREVQPGDLIRIYHFTAANRRRRVYMHKLIREVDGFLRAFDTTHIALQREKPHSCDLRGIEFEIIDGPSNRSPDGQLMCWWERPKTKETTND